MTDERSGRELTPREPGEVDTPGSQLTPVDGERRDVERFSAGPRAHSVSLTEERSAQIVRQSANARNVVFLAILLIALFIPIYWFYESGVPALGTEGRMAAEADVQYVTDVARGYELYLANCAECHGDNGQGGVGPPLNDQGKLYNVLTPAGAAGNGHLNPGYLDNVLTVGGRYVCGNPDSLMQAWKQPTGPLNYRQVEELIAWLTASQDVVFERKVETHGAEAEAAAEPEMVSGWRNPDYQPGPDDTPVPDCWTNPGGTTGTTSGATTSSGSAAATAPPVAGGTPEQPRVIQLDATAALQFTDPDGNVVPEIVVVPGETIEFQIDNTAGFDHNFWIGPAADVSVPNNETDVGHPTWQSGIQTVTWTVPASGEIPADLQFACTVPGHYAAGMHGNIVVASDAPAADTTPADSADTAPGDGGGDAATAPAGDTGGQAAGGGTPEEPRVIKIAATSSLQLLDESGAPLTSIDAAPGETIEFQVDNTAGFDHNFFIGTADELQVPFAETDNGIPVWQSGVQSFIWTVPESGADGLQFACTVPGHYTPMHGDIVISSGDAATTSGDAAAGAQQPAEGTDAAAADGGAAVAEPGAGGEGPRVVDLTATAALQFLAEDGAPLKLLDVSPGETIEFVIDNEAGFDHNFWIGPATEVSQPNVETDAGIPTWQSGVQTLTWVVPDQIPPDLQFGCTIPGHYAAGMHGDITISG